METKADDNIMRVSSRRSHGAYVNAAKKLFEKYQDIEIHGVAFAINNAIKASEMLETLGYATIKSIETESLPAQAESEAISVKVVIKLGKHASFDKIAQEYATRSKS